MISSNWLVCSSVPCSSSFASSTHLWQASSICWSTASSPASSVGASAPTPAAVKMELHLLRYFLTMVWISLSEKSTSTLNLNSALEPPMLSATTLQATRPTFAGVPEMMPFGEMERPAGSDGVTCQRLTLMRSSASRGSMGTIFLSLTKICSIPLNATSRGTICCKSPVRNTSDGKAALSWPRDFVLRAASRSCESTKTHGIGRDVFLHCGNFSMNCCRKSLATLSAEIFSSLRSSSASSLNFQRWKHTMRLS
mmetsp:Transcript_604/g.1402  ORF Transcript_604/g.1402 Transcript_604/m.1402 type:complete len:253 (-) Transcript_604:1552-2310(-)